MKDRELTDGQRPYFDNENPERGAAIDRLTAELMSAGRGAVVLWSRIEEIAGGGRYTSPAGYIIRAARKRIRRMYNIATRPIHTVGLRLLTREESRDLVPRDRRQRQIRQSRMMTDELNFDTSGMSNADRVSIAAQLDAARAERSLIRSGMRQSFRDRSFPTNPLRPLN